MNHSKFFWSQAHDNESVGKIKKKKFLSVFVYWLSGKGERMIFNVSAMTPLFLVLSKENIDSA